MTRDRYRAMSATTERRTELHTIMLAEVRSRMDGFIANLPADVQANGSAMMEAAYLKIAELGNGSIFNFFAADGISDGNFLRYCDDAIKGNIN
ncbi:MAG: hypothetical protein MJY60_04050 [Bacteroidales bacterium]|nr:hypothetical protein [Bacteroidales bacterium]